MNEAIGDPTILINNAGVLYCRPFLQHSSGQIENVMQTNLMGELNLKKILILVLIRKNDFQGRHSNQCHRVMALVTFLVLKYRKSRIFLDFIIKKSRSGTG